MRDQWLIMGAALGAVLLLPIAGSAQTMTVPPSWAPSLAQSPTMPSPDEFTPPPAAAPASPTAETKPAATTAKAKPHEMMAPAARAAAAPAAMPRRTGKRRTAGNAAHAPRDIVAEIYKVAAGRDGNYDGPSAFDDRRIRKLYFSKDLIAAVAATEKKAAGGSILNFDPITNSEGDVEDLNIARESEKPGWVSVAARFNSASDSSIIHYDFVKEGKLWKIDNIRGEIVGQQGQWSLREILKNSTQQS
ncbi:MAG: hypothetical protein ACREC1_01665 [Methylovirgula sp.]